MTLPRTTTTTTTEKEFKICPLTAWWPPARFLRVKPTAALWPGSRLPLKPGRSRTTIPPSRCRGIYRCRWLSMLSSLHLDPGSITAAIHARRGQQRLYKAGYRKRMTWHISVQTLERRAWSWDSERSGRGGAQRRRGRGRKRERERGRVSWGTGEDRRGESDKEGQKRGQKKMKKPRRWLIRLVGPPSAPLSGKISFPRWVLITPHTTSLLLVIP